MEECRDGIIVDDIRPNVPFYVDKELVPWFFKKDIGHHHFFPYELAVVRRMKTFVKVKFIKVHHLPVE